MTGLHDQLHQSIMTGLHDQLQQGSLTGLRGFTERAISNAGAQFL